MGASLLQAGMGGGTGRGAAPVVADIARQQGAFTLGIALVPQQQAGTSVRSNEVGVVFLQVSKLKHGLSML